MEYKVELEFGYENSQDTRKYSFDMDDMGSTVASGIQSGCRAVNASLTAGTSDGLDTFFVADDFDGTNGKFNRIISATVVMTEETVIF